MELRLSRSDVHAYLVLISIALSLRTTVLAHGYVLYTRLQYMHGSLCADTHDSVERNTARGVLHVSIQNVGDAVVWAPARSLCRF